jgi:hypothetical protein
VSYEFLSEVLIGAESPVGGTRLDPASQGARNAGRHDAFSRRAFCGTVAIARVRTYFSEANKGALFNFKRYDLDLRYARRVDL